MFRTDRRPWSLTKETVSRLGENRLSGLPLGPLENLSMEAAMLDIDLTSPYTRVVLVRTRHTSGKFSGRFVLPPPPPPQAEGSPYAYASGPQGQTTTHAPTIALLTLPSAWRNLSLLRSAKFNRKWSQGFGQIKFIIIIVEIYSNWATSLKCEKFAYKMEFFLSNAAHYFFRLLESADESSRFTARG